MLDLTIPQLFIAVFVGSLAMSYIAVRVAATVLVRLRLPEVHSSARSAFARAFATTNACETGLLYVGFAVVMSVTHVSERVLQLPTWCSVVAFICTMALCGFVGGRIERQIRRWTGVRREASLLTDLAGAYAAFHRDRARDSTPSTRSESQGKRA